MFYINRLNRMKSLHIIVSGRVQGVWFRDFVIQSCLEYPDVTGFVQNKTDGTVEILFEGKQHDLEVLLKQAKVGPPHARVEDVKAIWNDIDERKYKRFSRLN